MIDKLASNSVVNSILITLLLIFSVLTCSSVHAQEQASTTSQTNQKQKIEISGVDGDLLANINRNVELIALQSKQKKINVQTWSTLSKRVIDQIQEALKPFGYYHASVNFSKTTNSTDQEIYRYQVTLGAPVVLEKVTLDVKGTEKATSDFQDWLNRYPIKVGDILNQPIYESSKQTLLSLAIEYGYFDSELLRSRIIINEAKTRASIEIIFDSGIRYQYGDTKISWADGKAYKNISEELVIKFIKTIKGNDFIDSDLLSTQQAMLETVYFKSVEVRPLIEQREDSQVPISITLNPKKRFAYTVSLGIGTDTGPRSSISFEDRRFNNKGHKVFGNLGVSAEKQNAVLNYRVPIGSSPKDSINTFISYANEDSEFRIRETLALGTEVTRIKDDWQWSYGVSYRDESFIQDDLETDSALLIPRIRWQRTKVDDFDNPTKGWSASLALQGASESLVSDVDFAQVIANAKVLFPLGRGRLISRLELAGTEISDPSSLPSSLRFLTGGDNSIRGYEFESIGFEGESSIESASNLVAGSIEYEHPIKNNFGIAAFIDFGDAFNDNIDIKRGAGMGLRYRLPFGAVRLDVASALDLEDKPLRLHFTFGADL